MLVNYYIYYDVDGWRSNMPQDGVNWWYLGDYRNLKFTEIISNGSREICDLNSS